jgi:hypothetical protein
MDGRSEQWSLPELIDLEAALARWDGSRPVSPPPPTVERDRRRSIKGWLMANRKGALGEKWLGMLGVVTSLAVILVFALGIGAAWATLDRSVDGVHVVWFLATTLVVPWLLWLAGLVGWLFRRKHAFGWLGEPLQRMTSKLAGPMTSRLFNQARSGGELRRALGWRLARHSQVIAAAFGLGAATGLAVMVLFKQVGFFWETTTQTAMESLLNRTVDVLSAPWAWALPDLVPDVGGTRRGQHWVGGGESWWPFLLLTLLLWGSLPRFVLAGLASWRERRTLVTLAFQAPHHRRLWRTLTHVDRGADPQGPVDGALIIDVGGSVSRRDALRPFFLRRLRLNPARWEKLGVLDEGQEGAAKAALQKAPAGIVLLAEGWALSPHQMERSLQRVSPYVENRRLVLLVANYNERGDPQPPTTTECGEWEKFVDGLKGMELELVFFEEIAR